MAGGSPALGFVSTFASDDNLTTDSGLCKRIREIVHLLLHATLDSCMFKLFRVGFKCRLQIHV